MIIWFLNSIRSPNQPCIDLVNLLLQQEIQTKLDKYMYQFSKVVTDMKRLPEKPSKEKNVLPEVVN